MWWSRITFLGVFVAFILNILQPGYMQFYDVRKPLTAFLGNLKVSTQQVPTSVSTPTPSPTQEPPSTSIPTPKSTCQPPKNDFERILFAQGIGGCNAPNN